MEVARCAFGKPAEWGVAGLLAVFLLFVVTAYMVLLRDIWTPLLLTNAAAETENSNNVVLLGCVVVMIPFLVQRELHALRYNCYVGFASISILCGALCYRAWTAAAADQNDNTTAQEQSIISAATATTTTSFSDILFAFPIITLSFLSQFNILPIQSALIRPTRKRMQRVVQAAVGASGLLMYLFGVAGYLCFGADTQGNILLNLADDDNSTVVWAGRVGCGITILLALPMMVLPCRRNLLELLDCWIEYQQQQQTQAHYATETTSLLQRLPPARSHSLAVRVHVASRPAAHYGSTAMLLLVCYGCAVAAPGVAFVWSLCGSGMAFAIGFILPGACFLRIQRKYCSSSADLSWSMRSRRTTVGAWALVVAATVAAVACTSQTTYLLIEPRTNHT